MIINGTIFSAELIDILTELKAQLNANGIKLLDKMFDSGIDVMVQCPYHKNGQERRPSAGIRKDNGLFHCLACGETHTLPEVISYCLGDVDGYKWLTKNFLALEVSEREDIEFDMARNNVSDKSNILVNCNHSKSDGITEEELDSYRYTHPYMYKRGLNDNVIDLFDIGYDRATDSITFPVRDKSGRVLFVARRSVSSKRFDIPKGVEKPLYGLYECWDKISKVPIIQEKNGIIGRLQVFSEIYICEGLFDCLRLWTVGKLAVAGFGCLFNKKQIEQINNLPTRKIILATDNDEAGMKARDKLRSLIKGKIITEVELPKGRKDIGECTDDELLHLQEVF